MIVADTHIIIWKALKPEMLSENAKKAIFLPIEKRVLFSVKFLCGKLQC